MRPRRPFVADATALVTRRRQFDSEAALPIALDEGVAYVPGNAFTLGGKFSNALRLAFSAEDAERLELGVARRRRTYDR